MERTEYIRAVDTYGNMVYRIAYSYCKNQSDADDIVQNVFMKLLQSNTDFQDEGYLKKWLIRVTSNESKNFCHSFWRRRIVSLDDSEFNPSYEFLYKESSDLYDAVMELPDKYRIVIYLYYYEEYSVREIAEILHRKETAIQTQLMRARKKLKSKLNTAWELDTDTCMNGGQYE